MPKDNNDNKVFLDAELATARQLMAETLDKDIWLTGPDGLLKGLTKPVIETAVDEKGSQHLDFDKHANEGRMGLNSRNGKRSKPLVSDFRGEDDVEASRDRDGSFKAQIVKNRQ